MSKKQMIILVIGFILFIVYILSSATEYLDNGRYTSVVVPYEKIYGTSDCGKRDDKFYILDTKTGKYQQIRF